VQKFRTLEGLGPGQRPAPVRLAELGRQPPQGNAAIFRNSGGNWGLDGWQAAVSTRRVGNTTTSFVLFPPGLQLLGPWPFPTLLLSPVWPFISGLLAQFSPFFLPLLTRPPSRPLLRLLVLVVCVPVRCCEVGRCRPPAPFSFLYFACCRRFLGVACCCLLCVCVSSWCLWLPAGRYIRHSCR
jgi:hypothetical protein